MKYVHRMPFGAQFEDGATRFRLWAPGARSVELVIGASDSSHIHAMARDSEGWFKTTLSDAPAGTRYAYRIDDELNIPDPASRSNPDGVHAASEVVDPDAHSWRNGNWKGRPWEEAVVYELHIGTFTREGTFAAALDKLDYLRGLGITAIELMPVAAFAGARGWGYDGVLPFAPQASYGSPDALKRFIDESHARGLMVLLDVVYNHFGPEGNYLHRYAPQFFNAHHQTPWGAALNFDGPHNRTVRDFFIENALYWIEEFRCDGLRLDAVHAIPDESSIHFVDELAMVLHERVGDSRHVHLVLENDRNEARRLTAGSAEVGRRVDAQWNDDVHHALHVLVTGEKGGYYSDYAEQPLKAFARGLAEGFVYQGERSAFREGRPRGEPSTMLPPTAFVDFLQNHDQIGNRALGERIDRLANAAQLRTATACVLLAPSIPMLFMGEEFAASTPFQFFCDYEPELAAAVANGRNAEFASFDSFASGRSLPDANASSTFQACKLDWREAEVAPGADCLAFYRTCLAARHAYVMPLLREIERGGAHRVIGSDVIEITWPLRNAKRRLRMVATFGVTTVDDIVAVQGRVLFRDGATFALSLDET
ncbi:MAG TPA: malto-oligosyltrehalose trehalohydrolase [Casimicrobiaceae bacterium]|nr:malto-oligosyltrehalose trehalohydrolase [Casimicrobiaceae bacterium]